MDFFATKFWSFTLFIYLFNHFHHSGETGCGGGRTTEQGSKLSAPFYPPNHELSQTTDHNTGNYMPYSLRQVWGFFYVPEDYKHWRVVRQGLRFNRHYPHWCSTTVSLETNHLFSIASNWQISPWKMIHLLEILQSSESMRLNMRSSPHQIEVGAIWMNLHDVGSGRTSIINFLPQLSHSNLPSESDKLGKNSSKEQRKRTYLLKAMNTKNASHKFTFSLYKFVAQMIFFCHNENKQKETFKSTHTALLSVSDSNRAPIAQLVEHWVSLRVRSWVQLWPDQHSGS